MTSNPKRTSGPYTISSVKRGDGRENYIVTVAREGRVVGDVNVAATSSSAAYFNDAKPPAPPRKRGIRRVSTVRVVETVD